MKQSRQDVSPTNSYYNYKSTVQIPGHLVSKNDEPKRSEQKKKQLYQKLLEKFGNQLNPQRNEITRIFIEKTLKTYIFEQNRMLSSKELNSLEAIILKFQEEVSQNPNNNKEVSTSNKKESRTSKSLNKTNISDKYRVEFENRKINSQQQKNKILMNKLSEREKNQDNQLSQSKDNKSNIGGNYEDILNKIQRNSAHSQRSDLSRYSLNNINKNKDEKIKPSLINSNYSTQNKFSKSIDFNNNNNAQQQQNNLKNIAKHIGASTTTNLQLKKISLSQLPDVSKSYKKLAANYDEMSDVSSSVPRSVIMLDATKNHDEYAAILEYNTRQYQQGLLNQKLKKEQQKKILKEELDRQLAELEKRKKESKKEENNFHSQQLSWQERFDQEQKDKQIQHDKKQNQINQVLQQQVDFRKQIDKKDKKFDEKYQQGLVNLYDRQKREEQDKIDLKKAKEIEFMNKVWKESMKQREIEELKEKEALEKERNQSDQFGQFLEEINNKREAEQKRRLAEQKKVLNRWDSEFENKKIALVKKEKQDEYILKKQQAEEDQKFLQIEKQKQDRVEFLRNKMLQENTIQQNIKSININPLKSDSLEQGNIWRQEDQQFWQREAEKREKQLKNQKTYQKQLQKQINGQDFYNKCQVMSKQELLQNKEILRKIAVEQQQLSSNQHNNNSEIRDMKSNNSKVTTMQKDPLLLESNLLYTVDIKNCDRI